MLRPFRKRKKKKKAVLFQVIPTVYRSASVSWCLFQQNSVHVTVLTHRSQAKEKPTKNETIKRQTSYLAIIEFILIIGC